MKVGKTLNDLAAEITRRQASKRDFIVPTPQAVITLDKAESHVLSFGDNNITINDLAHQQIASHAEIPKPYYDRMRKEAPELLANNVNTWFNKYPSNRMVRTLDGKARAFLSDKYRPLENEDLAEAVLPVLLDLDVTIMSCEITERRLYIKAIHNSIAKDIPTGKMMGDGTHTIFDTCCPAITIGNSEVGQGSLSVMTSIFTRGCTNLATFGDKSIRKSHVGGKHELVEGMFDMLSDDTRKLTDKALWAQVRDVVVGSFDEAKFKALAGRIAETAEQRIEGDVVKVIDLASKRFTLNEGEKGSILKRLIEGGDLMRYGLFNAVTRTAEDIEDYDRATEFERIGGQIIELPKNEWQQLAMAA